MQSRAGKTLADEDAKVKQSITYILPGFIGIGKLETSRHHHNVEGSGTLPPDRGGGQRWEKYNNIDPTQNADLTQHQYFLLPGHILGFALKTKEWRKSFSQFTKYISLTYLGIFDIKMIRPVQVAPSVMDKLLFPEKGNHRQMINMVLTNSISDRADFVGEKGKARVILLHG